MKCMKSSAIDLRVPSADPRQGCSDEEVEEEEEEQAEEVIITLK